MIHGYPVVKNYCGGLQVGGGRLRCGSTRGSRRAAGRRAAGGREPRPDPNTYPFNPSSPPPPTPKAFMAKHGFKSIAEFKGASLPYFTSHTDLVARQKAAVAAKKAKVGLANDAEWSGDDFVENAESMVANS
jgi:hypothetical protein